MRIKKYQKFELALKRLDLEHDIQHVIEMNRISRLLHKVHFLPRQRYAVDFSHKFVIADKDLATEGRSKQDDADQSE